jgi:hypothetical protein
MHVEAAEEYPVCALGLPECLLEFQVFAVNQPAPCSLDQAALREGVRIAMLEQNYFEICHGRIEAQVRISMKLKAGRMMMWGNLTSFPFR